MFRVYQRRIPLILQADESLGIQAQLQLLCDTCRQNSSNTQYTALHLAVELDLKNVVTNDQLGELLDTRDSEGNIVILVESNCYIFKETK